MTSAKASPVNNLRTMVAFVWFLAAAAYAGYAAWTYTGLFQWLCERQDHIFGAHDTSVSFMATLFLCALPVYAVPRKVWAGSKAESLSSSTGVAQPALRTREEAAAMTRNVLVGLGLLSLLVAGGSAALATSRAHRTPVIVSVDLLHGQAVPDLAHADQAIVSGLEHPEVAAVLNETTNGSKVSHLYTPLTGPDWKHDQPILFVIREGLDPGAINGLGTTEPVRFGPALLLSHELPGEVRADWQKHGLVLSPGLLVLDEELGERNTVLWVICFMGVLLGLSFGAIGLVGPRLAAKRARQLGQ